MGVIFFNAGGRYEFKADIDLKLFVRKMVGTGKNFFYRNVFNMFQMGVVIAVLLIKWGKLRVFDKNR